MMTSTRTSDRYWHWYWQKDSEICEDNRLVAPPVIGEDLPPVPPVSAPAQHGYLLSQTEFDVCREILGIDEFPVVLRLPSPGQIQELLDEVGNTRRLQQ